MMLRALCLLLLLGAHAAPTAAAAGATWVLAPSAASSLQRALQLDTPLSGARLSASIQKDRVLVRGERDGATVLQVTLVRAEAGAPGAGLTVLEEPGPAPAELVAKLRARITAAPVVVPWQKLDPAKPKARQVQGEDGPSAEGSPGSSDLSRVRSEVELLLEVGKKEEALARLQAILPQTDPGLAADLAVLWRKAGDMEGARRALQKAEARTTGERVTLAVASGAIHTAEQALEAIGQSPACEATNVARVLSMLGLYVEAHKVAHALRLRDPSCTFAWEIEVESGLYAGYLDRIDAVSAEALKRFPKDDNIADARVSYLRAARRFEEAAEILLRLAHENPTSPGRLRLLNGAVMQIGSVDEAAQQRFLDRLRADLKKNPDDLVARFQLGTTLHYTNHFEESNALLAPLESKLYREHRLHIYLAMNDFNLGHRDEALARLNKAMKLPGDDPDLYYCRAELLRDTNRAQALADLKRYMKSSLASPLSNPVKRRKVQAMIKDLEACLQSGVSRCDSTWEHPRLAMARMRARQRGAARPQDKTPDPGPGPWFVGGGTLAVLLLAGVALWMRRRQRGRSTR